MSFEKWPDSLSFFDFLSDTDLLLYLLFLVLLLFLLRRTFQAILVIIAKYYRSAP